MGVLKGDIARLLRLMEHHPAARDFLDRWHDSDGLAFVGMGEQPSAATHPNPSHNHNHNHSHGGSSNPLGHNYSSLGLGYEGEEDGLYDGDNIGYRHDPDITPTEFAQLKRIYGGDPFPMTKDFNDEMDLWVPRQVYTYLPTACHVVRAASPPPPRNLPSPFPP